MCLLNAVLTLAIVNTYTWNKSYYLVGSPDIKKDQISRENTESKVIELFHIKDQKLYSSIYERLESLFTSKIGDFTLFKSETLDELHSKLNSAYDSILYSEGDDIDARYLLKESTVFTKMTPFYKQGKLNAILAKKNPIKINFSAMKCKKILNYEFKENINDSNAKKEIVRLKN